VLAQAGVPTTIVESEPVVGGGTRSAELTLPGFAHDICSAVHPLAVSSPAFQSFPLNEHGLEWIQPPIPLAHPFDDGSAAVLDRSSSRTCEHFGQESPLLRPWMLALDRRWPDLVSEILCPVLHIPSSPLLLACFGALAPWPALPTARFLFRNRKTRALFAGLAAHSVLPLEFLGSAVFAWVLALAAHAAGWPIPRGGSQKIAHALASYFANLGGRIVTGHRVLSLDEFSAHSLILCDVTPRQLADLAGGRLPLSFRRRLYRYRYGPGVFKIDWALSGPIPWKARECTQAGVIHLGGTMEEIAASERAVWQGQVVDRPFVLVAQPSLFDSSRAPLGKHTAWAYCHVPHASAADMTGSIENQIERFAPGFRECIIARHVFAPSSLERHNANLVGGDITGGANTFMQLLFRPTASLYRTPLKAVYLCSASTPPGGGVHGMCGFHAAHAALRDHRISHRNPPAPR